MSLKLRGSSRLVPPLVLDLDRSHHTEANSLFQASYFSIVSADTEGCIFAKAFLKSDWSRSWFSLLSSPATFICLICSGVLFRIARRIGIMDASRQTSLMSAPLNPSVDRTMSCGGEEINRQTFHQASAANADFKIQKRGRERQREMGREGLREQSSAPGCRRRATGPPI